MNICDSRKHDEIVYEGRSCPLCVAVDRIEELENELADLQEPGKEI